jgi:hypothetical protein
MIGTLSLLTLGLALASETPQKDPTIRPLNDLPEGIPVPFGMFAMGFELGIWFVTKPMLLQIRSRMLPYQQDPTLPIPEYFSVPESWSPCYAFGSGRIRPLSIPRAIDMNDKASPAWGLFKTKERTRPVYEEYWSLCIRYARRFEWELLLRIQPVHLVQRLVDMWKDCEPEQPYLCWRGTFSRHVAPGKPMGNVLLSWGRTIPETASHSGYSETMIPLSFGTIEEMLDTFFPGWTKNLEPGDPRYKP